MDEGTDSGAEKAVLISGSSESGVESDKGRSSNKLPPAPPSLNGGDETPPTQSEPATLSPESSSNDSTPSSQRGSLLSSSLKIDTRQESNLECQAYTSTHLEALRLRREAGKVRAYSFNDSIAKSPEKRSNRLIRWIIRCIRFLLL